MDTMVVTGGAGFIGANFVRLALQKTSARVIVFDKLTYAGNLLSLSDAAPLGRAQRLREPVRTAPQQIPDAHAGR